MPLIGGEDLSYLLGIENGVLVPPRVGILFKFSWLVSNLVSRAHDSLVQ